MNEIYKGMDNAAEQIDNNFKGIKDYVIEQGDNYTKWESGKLEQWGSIDAGVLSLTRQRGNIFISEESLRLNFPYEFIKEPILTLIPDSGVIIGLYIGEVFSSGADVWPFSALRHERQVEYSYHAIGRWKE